ncbi:MAG TPA: hypothetical protein P5511_10075, partial [Candidatus Goldiibacteriota bacterium]|nr:hypothetical protein [Candidatus Goldiibacteriota bacterium]
MSKFGIMTFAGNGNKDSFSLFNGVFRGFGDFRRMKLPNIMNINLNADLPFDEWVRDMSIGNPCDIPGCAEKGIMEAAYHALGITNPAEASNMKIIGEGKAGNAVLDYLTNTESGLGNTTNRRVMQDLSGLVIAGAYLGTGGIDEKAMADIMMFKEVAQNVSVGMAIIGAVQMVSNPGFAAYLMQGAVGYAKTWAEGLIKAYAFQTLDGLIKENGVNQFLNDSWQKLGGKSQLPPLTAGQAMNLFDQVCPLNNSPQTWDLSDFDWDDVWEITKQVAQYASEYSGEKSDLMKGSDWMKDFLKRDVAVITDNIKKVDRLVVKASAGSEEAPLTVDEEMIGLLGSVLKMLQFVPEPVTSG